MVHGFTVREHIEREPAQVWSYLADLRNAPAWMKGVEALEPITPGPIKHGSRLALTLDVRGRGSQRETLVSAFEPPRRLALTSKDGGVSAVYEYVLFPSGAGTNVELRAVCTASGAWRIVKPLIVLLMRRHDGDQLVALRDAIQALPLQDERSA